MWFKKKANEASATMLAYRRLFSTEDGQLVLKDLMTSCFFNRPSIGKDPYETYFNEGARSVIIRIIETSKLTEEQVEALRKRMLAQIEMGGDDVY